MTNYVRVLRRECTILLFSSVSNNKTNRSGHLILLRFVTARLGDYLRNNRVIHFSAQFIFHLIRSGWMWNMPRNYHLRQHIQPIEFRFFFLWLASFGSSSLLSYQGLNKTAKYARVKQTDRSDHMISKIDSLFSLPFHLLLFPCYFGCCRFGMFILFLQRKRVRRRRHSADVFLSILVCLERKSFVVPFEIWDRHFFFFISATKLRSELHVRQNSMISCERLLCNHFL